ncbi:MAG TPA: AAA family ATPase [Stellaceae bacterium]|nr:AAA family ATPase [Stellaceae bacterium]
MQCPHCHTDNRAEASFCRGCGRKLGTAGRPGDGAQGDSYFCDTCGANLALASLSHGNGLPLAGAPEFPGAALESERKQVTVLFADITNSTKLIAGRDPEEARELLDPVIEAMMDSVHIYGGTVNQIQGDGIMALFGAPLYHEDHAVRACYAALHLHENLARAEGMAQRAGMPVQAHIGISSGEVLVRTITSDLSKGYNAVGEMIHLGARLQQLARPGATLCSSETIRLAGGLVAANTNGHTVIKGLLSPVEVFELVGARAAQSRVHAAAAQGLTPFLGREREHEALRLCLHRAAAGHGQVAALVGEAGIGKSRLVWEFVRSPATGGWLMLEAGGVSYGRDIPYLPIITLLKTCFELGDQDDAAAIGRKVGDKLRALGAAAEHASSAILALLGIEVDDPAWRAMDPLRRRETIGKAVVQLLCRLSQRSPLIVVVEDLHWIDSETQMLLEALVAALAAQPILLLVNYRPGYHPGWPEGAPVTALEIEPLTRDMARHLARLLLGDDETVRNLQTELVERTEGNPFFLEESVRALAEARLLEGKPGAFRLAEGFSKPQVPASVRAVLGARIDRLAPADKRLLQAAAAIGSKFPLTLLRQLVKEEEQETLHGRLARLKEARLIFESSLYPELQYSFGHTLTQEVAYESLLQSRRRELHARIGEAIEALYAGRISEHLETLAYHAFRGEIWEKAASYARRAGQKAAAQSAYREAVAHFEQSLAAFAKLAPREDRLAAAIDTRFELRNALFPLGKINRDLEHLREAERLAGTLADRGRLAWISAYIARDLSLLGNPDEALEAGERALELTHEIGDDDLRVLINAYIGQAHYALGNYRRSAEIMAEQVRAIPADGLHLRFGLPGPAAVFFRAWLVWAVARRGRFAEAAPLAEDMLKVAAATDQPLCLTVAQYSHGFLLLHRADFAAAIPILERSLELCRDWGFSAWFTNIASSLGYAYAAVGRCEEGLDLLGQAIRQTRAIGIMVSHANEVAWLAEASLAAGRSEEGKRHAEAAIELARQYKEKGNEAEALRIRGEAGSRGGAAEREAAVDSFLAALSLAESCEMKVTALRCHLGLARAYRRGGQWPAAGPHLAAAQALLQEPGMEHWSRLAEER